MCRQNLRRGRPAAPRPHGRHRVISAAFAQQDLVGPAAMAQPQLVGFLAVPRGGAGTPSISYCSEFLRPALIWLTAIMPRAPLS